MGTIDLLAAVLLAFYLYLLVRKGPVSEPGLYRLGLMGFLVMFVGVCFGLGNLQRTQLLFQWIGFLWALLGIVAACGGFRGPYDSKYRPHGWGAPNETDSEPDESEET